MTLSPFENVTYQTTALSTGADSVMHLMRDDGMGYTQVAYNDNYGGGLGSRISFTNSSTTRDYLLVVRARSSVTHGSADLFRNGTLVPDVIPIGGFIYDGSLVTQGANNTLHLVPQPNQIGTMPSSTWPVMFALNSTETTIVRTGLSGGAGGATAMSAAPTIDRLLIGTPTYYHGSQPAPVSYRDGWARALVNDFASDTDGDGLGDALENALGTCDGTTTCPNAYTARDTDRDGLNDYDEVLGVIGPLGNGLDDISLPRWGASPLHKDVFVEVDYTYAPTSDFSIPSDFPNPYARPFDVEQWVSDLRSAYDVGPNSHLHNPDGEDGVSVHVDIGVEPLDPKDEVFFGDYPSASARPLVQNQTLTFSATPSGIVYVRVDNQWRWFDATGLTNPALITEIWLAIYDTGRGVGASIDASDMNNWRLTLFPSAAGVHYDLELVYSGGGLHEITGESIPARRDRYHTDPAQVDSARVGRFRYAVVNSTSDGGGQAHRAMFVTAPHYTVFGHELGHTLGLMHYGIGNWFTGDPNDADTLGNEIQCIPHYFSTMNYAYNNDEDTYFFSDRDPPLTLNSTSVPESNTLQGDDQSLFADAPFNIVSSVTGTDWNRSGVVSGTYSSALRAANYQSCRLHDIGWQAFEVFEDQVIGEIDLARLGDYMYAFYTREDGIVRYRVAELGTPANGSCTGPENPLDYPEPGSLTGGCLDWSGELSTPIDDSQGLSVYGYDDYMFVAILRDDGAAEVTWLDQEIDGTLTYTTGNGFAQPVNRTEWVPELGVLQTTSGLELAFVRVDSVTNEIRHYRWTGGGWSYAYEFEDTTGSAILSDGPVTMTLFLDEYQTGYGKDHRRSCAIFPTVDGAMRFFCIDPTVSNDWIDLTADFFRHMPTPDSDGNCTTGRTAEPVSGRCTPTVEVRAGLTYRYIRNDAGVPARVSGSAGHFQVVRSFGNAVVDLTEELTRNELPTTAGVLEMNWDWSNYLRNEWGIMADGTGVSVYNDSEMGAVFGLALNNGTEPEKGGGLVFYPHMDGTPDLDLFVGSDFRIMEDYICQDLAWAGGEPCGPINVFD